MKRKCGKRIVAVVSGIKSDSRQWSGDWRGCLFFGRRESGEGMKRTWAREFASQLTFCLQLLSSASVCNKSALSVDCRRYRANQHTHRVVKRQVLVLVDHIIVTCSHAEGWGFSAERLHPSIALSAGEQEAVQSWERGKVGCCWGRRTTTTFQGLLQLASRSLSMVALVPVLTLRRHNKWRLARSQLTFEVSVGEYRKIR